MQTRIRCLFALGLSLAASAQAAQDRGSSYTPIIGYDDKDGALFGAAAFFYQEGRPGINTGVYGVTNGKDFDSMTVNVDKRSASGMDLSLHSSAARSFDNYYGEGDDTSDLGGLRLAQERFNAQASALKHVSQHWALGPSLGLKIERQGAVTQLDDRNPVELRSFADSADPALGFRAAYDDRDSTLSSRCGGTWGLDVRALPAKLALIDGTQDAYQAEAEWRQFHAVGKGVVLAHRLAGGASLGQPSYAERYSLGGTAQLRGFEDDRFRGDQYYCLQEEVRVPVWKALSAAASVDLGDVSDGVLSVEHPRHSVQAGVRLGIPPSYGMKARLDLGYGDSGEHSLALQFGETF